ncbi:vitamin-D-receptor interacting mediator subunit 4-domain-containing protein [Xylaria bambusicola]|uniref:vitamin-D-receptor interacting mediator subunit 4-domain-containing protein n=1 Tax=Xylaria bambusicola TaxID=326684 RepID=UPI0020083914|nr:vitamin-D-receptor interacting mediator subunit 4-domain-containing protein [Xylaria bambusicola]KAI0521410.1 vitamin-D-receptor interacting mediator subunit 4-domain-containing protein [Xylaria bambusicola]
MLKHLDSASIATPTMNKQLDSCFDRVEKALGTLIDSIAKYNPSTTQVQELGNADAELNKGLQDLQTHQSNYQRLQDLRASTARYDAQIKDTLRLLANTRKELVHASATVFPDGPNYEIRYDELLSYARRISKTTIPPVGAANAISAAMSEAKGGEASSAPETAATTPAGGTPNGATPQAQQPLPTTVNGGASSTDLPEQLAIYLNPHSAYTFVPWPSEEQVRHGAIASLAYMAEQGIEAEGYDPEAERARKEREEEERKEAEERERVEREERERRMREEQARLRAERERNREKEAESWRRASVSTGGAPQPSGGPAASASPTQPKAQFQFMGDDDDDDDD